MNILFQMFLNLKVIKQSLCCYRTCNSCACSGSSHFEVLRHIGNILEKIYLSLVCHHWALRWAVLLGKGGGILRIAQEDDRQLLSLFILLQGSLSSKRRRSSVLPADQTAELTNNWGHQPSNICWVAPCIFLLWVSPLSQASVTPPTCLEFPWSWGAGVLQHPECALF